MEGGSLGGGVRPPLHMGLRALSGDAKWWGLRRLPQRSGNPPRGRFQDAAKSAGMTVCGWEGEWRLCRKNRITRTSGFTLHQFTSPQRGEILRSPRVKTLNTRRFKYKVADNYFLDLCNIRSLARTSRAIISGCSGSIAWPACGTIATSTRSGYASCKASALAGGAKASCSA